MSVMETNNTSPVEMEVDGEQAEIQQPTGAPFTSNFGEGASVLASSSGIASALLVSLHPLVIMNISEHWTRTRAQSEFSANNQIVGALIGKQKGRNVEIMNSFELKFDLIDNQVTIDNDYYKLKEGQFKQVFADMEILGWYKNGDIPSENDLKIHRQLIQFNESLLFLKLNPLGRMTGLPIKIYESIIDLVNGEPKMLFVEAPYTLATEEAERIGLDHMARMSSSSQGGDPVNSVVTEHLRVQYSAVKMLRDRIKLILDFIRETNNQTLPFNHDLVREISNLCHRLPLVNSNKFNEDFYIQCNDVALITYLGTITKCSSTINQYVNKFTVLQERTGGGRSRSNRPPGLLY